MLPVLNAEQVRTADAHTMVKEPIASIDLMERAAGRCTERIMRLLADGELGPRDDAAFLVLAGMGGNGGDGLVIARLLHAAGVPVRVVRIVHRRTPSPENAINWERLSVAHVPAWSLEEPHEAFRIAANEVVIDAIFGIGTKPPVPDVVAWVIEEVRRSGRPVIAVDLPSGSCTEDNTGNDPERIMRAVYTITFEVPKLVLFMPESEQYTGSWEVLPIGSDLSHPACGETPYHMLEEADVAGVMRPRPRFGHKGGFGHVLLVAGSEGKAGAAVLATGAALRSGVGMVTAHVPRTALCVLQSTCPEAMCSLSNGRALVDTPPPDLAPFSAIGIGPGLGTHPDTARVLDLVIDECKTPMVLDADALNILAANPLWMQRLPKGTILTPHPKEFDRLAGVTAENGHQRLQHARRIAKDHGLIIVLKGAWTAVCDPTGRVTFNPTGNPGMAKGGSGDALTGLLAGILAQGYAPLHAARLGVYLHGAAGDLAAQRRGMDGMVVSDLIHAIPETSQGIRALP